MNFLKKSLIVMSLAAASLFVLAQSQDPAEILKQINADYSAKLTEARNAGKTVNTAELLAERKTKAQDAVKGVDPMKVEPAQGLSWAQLFQIAGQDKDACMAAERYLTSNPDAAGKYTAQSLMLTSCNNQGEAKNVLKLIMEMQPSNFNQGASLAMNTIYSYAGTINDKLGLNQALAAYDRADAILAGLKPENDQQKKAVESYQATSVGERAELLNGAGRKKDALAVIDKAIAALPEGSPSLRTLNSTKIRIKVVGDAPPAMTFERGYGDFPGIEALKGKVVVVDFFAHWCPPCKAAFPDMRQMYSDLKDKGLEIVGVTTYYGYYGTEKNLSKDDEFAKMKDFISDFSLPWPIQYGDRSNFEAYGITGIPTTILIGRDGKVHSLHVGYSPESFKAFRAEVEKLVNQK